MKIHSIPLTKAQLDAMPEKERRLFIQLSHFMNDQAILSKLMVIHHPRAPLPEAQMRTGMATFLLLSRLLVGKAWEGWLLLQKDFLGSGLKQTIKLESAEQASLVELGKHFSKQSLLKTIRDKHAFHYDGASLMDSLASLDPAFSSVMYAHDHVGNWFYGISEDLIMTRLSQLTGNPDPTDASYVMFRELMHVNGLFNDVAGGILRELIVSHFGKSFEDMGAQIIEVGTSPLQSARLSYFVVPVPMERRRVCFE